MDYSSAPPLLSEDIVDILHASFSEEESPSECGADAYMKDEYDSIDEDSNRVDFGQQSPAESGADAYTSYEYIEEDENKVDSGQQSPADWVADAYTSYEYIEEDENKVDYGQQSPADWVADANTELPEYIVPFTMLEEHEIPDNYNGMPTKPDAYMNDEDIVDDINEVQFGQQSTADWVADADTEH